MNKKGFTLLELLVAISLFAVGMLSVLQIFPVNRRYLTQSGNVTQASLLAQEQAEIVRQVEYGDLTVGYYEARHAVGTGSNDPLNQYERETVVSLIDSNRNATATDIGLKKIVINLYWKEQSVNRQYTLTTYAHNE